MTHARISAVLLLLTGCMTPTGDSGDEVSESAPSLTARSRDDATTSIFRLMGRNAIWTRVSSVEMQGWTTFHTQGLVRIGDAFFVSSVEVIEPTVRNGAVTDALYDFSIDRSPGVGRGWLTKFDAAGNLLGQIELTDGTIYHPGGIDFDGESLWVPVAEYRPNSRSEILRVDPDTLAAERIFTADDHIGGVVHDLHRGTLEAVSWGSRRLYTFPLHSRRDPTWVPNTETTIDYQDCHYHGIDFMLCGGVAGYETPYGPIAFGGLDLVDLRTKLLSHQVPVNRFIEEAGLPNPTLSLSHNAFWADPLDDTSLRIYFMTESDNQASLLAYDATPWIHRSTPASPTDTLTDAPD
jgi:hypothetical protein